MREVSALKTDVSACYEHVNSFQLRLNLVNWAVVNTSGLKQLLCRWDGHTPLFTACSQFGSDLQQCRVPHLLVLRERARR